MLQNDQAIIIHACCNPVESKQIHMAMFAEIVQDYCKNRDRILELEQECEQLKNERDQYKSKCEAYAHEQWEAERAKAGRM